MNWTSTEKSYLVAEKKDIDFITAEHKFVFWELDDGKLLDKLPKHITHLQFGDYYDDPHPIPNHITHLEFGCDYNQDTPLPNSITHLTFGDCYNQTTPLPNSVKHLTFETDQAYSMIFPSSLLTLKYFVPNDGSLNLDFIVVAQHTIVSHEYCSSTIKYKYEEKFIRRGDYYSMTDDEKLELLIKHNLTCFEENVIELLNKKLKPNKKNLINAIKNRNDKYFDLCLNYGCQLNEEMLYIACRYHHKYAIQKCIKFGFAVSEDCVEVFFNKKAK